MHMHTALQKISFLTTPAIKTLVFSLALSLALLDDSWAQKAPIRSTLAANATAISKVSNTNNDTLRGQKFLIEPIPAWVNPVAIDETAVQKLPKSPMHYQVVDLQTRLDKNTSVSFNRSIKLANDASALKDLAQIEFNFEPSYETLVIHTVALLRQGKRIEKLDRQKIQVLHREQQLDRQLLDGRLTASMVLDDVRVGDSVEVAYSIKGSNPVFDGMFSDLAWSVRRSGPIALFQYRLLAAENRSINIKADASTFDITSNVTLGWRDTSIRRKLVTQYQHDDNTPIVEWLSDLIQVSEFKDWAHVAAWAEKTFASSYNTPSETVQEQARQINRSVPNQAEAQIKATLDFVQKEIRYFGTETGANSHRPAIPEQTLRLRYGDCKDKTSLLIALLRAQNIEAKALLVNSNLNQDVNRFIPSPMQFDHVVAQIQVNNQTWTLDATSDMQTGSINERQANYLGAGLLASATARDLTQLPSQLQELQQFSLSKLVFTSLAQAPVLEVQNSYYGSSAENIRAWLASPRASEMRKQLESDVARSYKRAILVGEVVAQELPDQNALRIVMKFNLPDYLPLNKQQALASEVFLHSLADVMRIDNQAQKTKASYIKKNPSLTKQTIEIHLPPNTFDRPAPPGSFSEVNPYFDLQTKYEMQHDRIVYTGMLGYKSDRIAALAWNDYVDTLKKIWPRLTLHYTLPVFNAQARTALETQLKTIDENRRRGIIKANSKYQADAYSEIVIADARLATTHYSEKNKALLLTHKGVHQDALGKNNEAAASFAEATRLDPNNTDTLSAQAANALILGKDALTLSTLARAQQLNPTQFEASKMRALAHYYAGNVQSAREELLQVLKKSDQLASGYAALWLYVMNRQTGRDGTQALDNFKPQLSANEWPMPILHMLNNSLTFEQALAKAQENNSQSTQQSTELYFFYAQKLLADKRTTEAKEYFQKVVQLGIYEYLEYGLAQRELKRLGE